MRSLFIIANRALRIIDKYKGSIEKNNEIWGLVVGVGLNSMIKMLNMLVLDISVEDESMCEKAKNIATDFEYRVYQDEVRKNLLDCLERYFWDLAKAGQQEDSREKIKGILDTYIDELLEKKEELKLKHYEVKRLEELKEILNDKSLPKDEDGDKPGEKQKLFREFIAREYFSAGDREKQGKKDCPAGYKCSNGTYYCGSCKTGSFQERIKDNHEVQSENRIMHSGSYSSNCQARHYCDDIIEWTFALLARRTDPSNSS